MAEQKILYDGLHDAQFTEPYIDVDEWRDAPVRHRYVHGGFHGNETRFCFYFPEKAQYQNRFFHFLMPVQGPETSVQGQEGEEDMISFSILHGAYFVQTNMGGIVNGGGDDTLVYRCSAQAAEFSRKLAKEMYETDIRPYGYVYGGSGGGFKTMSCAENTIGIWDGAVPFVIGSPVAMPNVFTVRAHAMRLLRHKMADIVDAIEPGGSGDPYVTLNEEEAAALREAFSMGFPMETWTVWETLGEGALPVLAPAVPMIDPTYFTDFWEKDGYLGADPNGSAVRDRVHLETEIAEIHHTEFGKQGIADTIDEGNSYGVDEAWKHQIGKGGNLPVFSLKDSPWDNVNDAYARGLTLRFLDGALVGETISVSWLGYSLVTGTPDASGRDLAALLARVKVGDHVLLDNSNYLAIQTYHRHQVPGEDFHAWDIFRNPDGTPAYPQRPFLVGPIIAKGGAGGVQEGTPQIKMIVLESHMDESAFPWQADWYREKIRDYCRETGKNLDDVMRLYYMEHCMHTDCQEGNGGDHDHIVSYLGALHQALLDLSDWVERGIAPVPTTGYSMDGGQVLLADGAAKRRGVQAVVNLCAETAGQTSATGRIEVKAGEPVHFIAEVEIPARGGNLEESSWGFENNGIYLAAEQVGGHISPTTWLSDGTGRATAEATHTFTRPGTYFVVAKIATNRTPGDLFTRIRNQARMRVVVRD